MNRDRGAATALSAILVLALLAVLVLVLQIGAATIARHRAEGAADLAALAAAAHAPSGAESACER
ncbi:Rv3654c family TadE-like protein, partial [Saccharopolyspora kobensis]